MTNLLNVATARHAAGGGAAPLLTAAPFVYQALPPDRSVEAMERAHGFHLPSSTLHIGHTLTVTLEDALIRHKRMKGAATVWVPGLDHAGIATQAVVEKSLQKQGKPDRRALGREAFVQEVWKWKDKYGGIINEQLRRTGASLDWERSAFTMDPQRSAAVTEAFVQLFDNGLLYRAERLVNWCPHLQTALSDIEVEHIDVAASSFIKVPDHPSKVEVGVLHRFVYQLEGGGEIEVATTRPETMFGDVAIAVHPDDERFKHAQGRFALHPFLKRRMPVVLDKELVQLEMGTGAVKITPAHDQSDFDCAKRHKLPFINVLTDDGKMAALAGEGFAGLNRFAARTLVVSRLEEMGLYRGKIGHPTRLALCSRSGDVIEPLLKPQWYLACEELAAKAKALVAEGTIKLTPYDYTAEWNRWLDNSRDWCVSRQLWWGHRIPAYRVSVTLQQQNQIDVWVAGRTEAEARSKAAAKLCVTENEVIMTQDDDVLDTWFSSALFPLSTMGWPTSTDNLERFYPISVMETGADILFFWVARMVMLCTHLTGIPPFKSILLHPLVRDSEGRKMSKSLGNVIDPLQVAEGATLQVMQEALKGGNLDSTEAKRASATLKVEYPQGIPECGMDALRFALADYTHQGRAINMSISRIVAVRHFCNKIWNASRFVLSQLEPNSVSLPELPSSAELRLPERWLLSRLDETVQRTEEAFEGLQLHKATSAFHSFFLYDFCDSYIEWSKLSLRSADKARRSAAVSVLLAALEISLRLLHPFMPFLSEELWQRLPRSTSASSVPSIMLAPFPQGRRFVELIPSSLNAQMQQLQDIVHAARSLRDSFGIDGPAPFQISAPDQSTQQLLLQHAEELTHFTRAKNINVTLEAKALEQVGGRAIRGAGLCAVAVELTGLVNPTEELKKVKKRIDVAEKRLRELDARVQRPGYDTNVPLAVKEKDQAERAKQRLLVSELQGNKDVLAAVKN